LEIKGKDRIFFCNISKVPHLPVNLETFHYFSTIYPYRMMFEKNVVQDNMVSVQHYYLEKIQLKPIDHEKKKFH
jgi:hypothetical protein